ncbi:MAG: alanine racemase [Cyanobacteria bacterium P01_C01_bin.89]
MPSKNTPQGILAVPAENRASKPDPMRKPNVNSSPTDRLLGLERERAWVTIDLNSLAHNVQVLQRWVGPRVEIMAVVKADAYGHGAIAATNTVLSAGATRLAVATLEEGIELRQANIDAPILVLGLLQNLVQMQIAVDHNLELTLCTLEQVERLAGAARASDRPLKVHINIDTGMSRLGVSWQDARSLVQQVYAHPSLELASIYSHFATADEPDPLWANRQHQRFNQVIAQIESLGRPLPPLHMANSAAILSNRNFHYDWVRPGLALYGLCPAEFLGDRLDLKPVLSVHARVAQIRTINPGEGVSYGHRFVAQRPTQVATVSIGYADGVPRRLSGQLSVMFNDQLIPQIGAITMDQLLLDVTETPRLKPGNMVTLLGTSQYSRKLAISAQDWADQLGTISWEILSGFRNRLPRITLPMTP